MPITTTISLKKETVDKLKMLGRKGDTYDDIVNRLIDFYNNHNANKTDKNHNGDIENV